MADTTPTRPATICIDALYEGYTIAVSFEGTIAQLPGYLDRLRALGAQPTTPQARAAVAEEAAREAPHCACGQCDRYGKPMKPSTKAPGSYYCSGKVGFANGQPVYCKEKA